MIIVEEMSTPLITSLFQQYVNYTSFRSVLSTKILDMKIDFRVPILRQGNYETHRSKHRKIK